MLIRHFLPLPFLAIASLAILLALAACRAPNNQAASIVLKPGAKTATITWTTPTTNTDGSPLKDLSAINVYQGTSPEALRRVTSTKPSVREYVATGLKTGTYYFALRSVNTEGIEGPQIVSIPVVVP
jgi:hypothetical protein